MAEKEVYLGVQVQTRRMVDRAVERAAPVLRKILPEAVDAELTALDSEVEHLDQVIGSAGLEGRPVHAEEMSWLMHRSCSLGLPAPRNMPAVHLNAQVRAPSHRRGPRAPLSDGDEMAMGSRPRRPPGIRRRRHRTSRPSQLGVVMSPCCLFGGVGQ